MSAIRDHLRIGRDKFYETYEKVKVKPKNFSGKWSFESINILSITMYNKSATIIKTTTKI